MRRNGRVAKRAIGWLLAMLIMISITVASGETQYVELQVGSTGSEVRQLQERLKELGFYTISVDGDYGKGTVNAVKAFEEYNGMEQTGIATVELQEFLYSEDAKGIPIPDVEISAVGLKKSYGYYYLRPTLVNHTDYTIDAVTFMLKAYAASGERVGYASMLTVNDILRYPESDAYEDYYCKGELNKLNLKPGKSYSVRSRDEIDLYHFESDLLDTVYIAVVRYTTSDGTNIDIPENDQIWYGSNGKSMIEQYENNVTPNPELTFEIEDQADSYIMGVWSYGFISNFNAEVAGLPVGGVYIFGIDSETILADAGFKEGDIIIKIGDVWTYDEESFLLAKGMAKDEEVTIVFYRRGQRCEKTVQMS